MRLRLISLFAVVAVAVPGIALAARTGEGKFEAYLSGKTEVPKGAPAGKGQVNVTIVGTKVCWTFSKIKGIDTAGASHIHKGNAGVAGPVVVPLGAKFQAKGCITAAAAVARAIAAKPSGYYVNVHTTKYPGGAIRGQLHAGD